MSTERSSQKRRLLGGLSGVCTTFGAGALMTAVLLSIGTAAGATDGVVTTPQPTPREVAAARHGCAVVRHHASGNPSVVDNGDGLYVSLWPVQQTCIFSGSGVAAASYPVPAPSKGVAADSIQRLSGVIDVCESNCVPRSQTTATTTPSTSTNPAVTSGRVYVDATFLDGIIGRDVTGATVKLSNRKSVRAVVENGHYLAWWDSDNGTVTGMRVIATLKNGKAASFPVPPLLLAKFCTQQMQEGASVCFTPVDEN